MERHWAADMHGLVNSIKSMKITSCQGRSCEVARMAIPNGCSSRLLDDSAVAAHSPRLGPVYVSSAGGVASLQLCVIAAPGENHVTMRRLAQRESVVSLLWNPL